MITCPKCGSQNWRCWDERNEWFEIKATGELFEYPVGYLACKDCGHSFIHYDEDDETRHIGNDRQAFGRGEV